jgi:threonine dehydrogenase-like Zn-dependent dehydrogenase
MNGSPPPRTDKGKAVVERLSRKKGGVRLAESCAVFGAGAIGLLVTMLLRQARIPA